MNILKNTLFGLLILCIFIERINIEPAKLQVMDNQAIIFFDGVCNFCNHSVQFVIKRDPVGYFKFSPLQSALATQLLAPKGIDLQQFDTVILVEKGKVYTRSTAALRVCKHLRGLWPALQVLLVIPRPIRDMVYNFIAKRRYAWFGKKEACMLPTPDIRRRFVTE